MSKRFRVVKEEPACSHCKCGAKYTVCYDDGGMDASVGMSWGGPPDDAEALEAAESHCNDLNWAYEKAAEDRESSAPSSPLEKQS